jgi:hypothetical protein
VDDSSDLRWIHLEPWSILPGGLPGRETVNGPGVKLQAASNKLDND